MNETIRELFDRKSVRAFTGKPISEEDKKDIIMAAVNAPSPGNQQLYTILDITDPAMRHELSVLCDNQPFMEKADMMLIFCADFQKWYDVFDLYGCEPRKPEAGDLILSVEDALIASQNAVTAAQSLGIGSCYIGDVMENCEKMRELLDLPEYVFPATLLVFGYPTRLQIERKKPARPLYEDIVMVNGYKRKGKEDLEKLFSSKTEGKDFTEWIRAFCKRKYNSDFSKEMSRSVCAYLKDWLE